MPLECRNNPRIRLIRASHRELNVDYFDELPQANRQLSHATKPATGI
jgi:hypothetical protein